MMNLRTIIIDDEKSGIETLTAILTEFCPQVTIIETTTSPLEGVQLINKTKPDLVFIDIEMPVINGFDVIKTVDHNCKVILITAHNNYAAEAFQTNVSNYILKPVGVSDIVESVRKISENGMIANITELVNNIQKFEERTMGSNRISIACSGYTEVINREDVLFLKAEHGCVEIHTEHKRIISTLTLSKLCERIGKNMVQTHKSYYVNIEKVERVYTKDLEVELVNGLKIPISRRKKEDFINLLNNRM